MKIGKTKIFNAVAIGVTLAITFASVLLRDSEAVRQAIGNTTAEFIGGGGIVFGLTGFMIVLFQNIGKTHGHH